MSKRFMNGTTFAIAYRGTHNSHYDIYSRQSRVRLADEDEMSHMIRAARNSVPFEVVINAQWPEASLNPSTEEIMPGLCSLEDDTFRRRTLFGPDVAKLYAILDDAIAGQL